MLRNGISPSLRTRHSFCALLARVRAQRGARVPADELLWRPLPLELQQQLVSAIVAERASEGAAEGAEAATGARAAAEMVIETRVAAVLERIACLMPESEGSSAKT